MAKSYKDWRKRMLDAMQNVPIAAPSRDREMMERAFARSLSDLLTFFGYELPANGKLPLFYEDESFMVDALKAVTKTFGNAMLERHLLGEQFVEGDDLLQASSLLLMSEMHKPVLEESRAQVAELNTIKPEIDRIAQKMGLKMVRPTAKINNPHYRATDRTFYLQ